MIVIMDTGLYGKIDQVPGLFHVATRFFHVYYVPLIPLGCYLVREDRENDEGWPLRWSLKSVAFAWLRVLLLLGGLGALLAAGTLAIKGLEGRGKAWPAAGIALVVATVLFALLHLSYRITRAGPLRALELARQAGVTPEQVAGFFVDDASVSELENAAYDKSA